MRSINVPVMPPCAISVFIVPQVLCVLSLVVELMELGTNLARTNCNGCDRKVDRNPSHPTR